ncbi:MAG: hypothetical protein MZV64_15770 [Ignavibacteriales bacterium]|nr:hypothetical protein [Ignavibacteriales bacterium]
MAGSTASSTSRTTACKLGAAFTQQHEFGGPGARHYPLCRCTQPAERRRGGLRADGGSTVGGLTEGTRYLVNVIDAQTIKLVNPANPLQPAKIFSGSGVNSGTDVIHHGHARLCQRPGCHISGPGGLSLSTARRRMSSAVLRQTRSLLRTTTTFSWAPGTACRPVTR